MGKEEPSVKQVCPHCGHLRVYHSKLGCGSRPCPVTYMDLSPRKK